MRGSSFMLIPILLEVVSKSMQSMDLDSFENKGIDKGIEKEYFSLMILTLEDSAYSCSSHVSFLL